VSSGISRSSHGQAHPFSREGRLSDSTPSLDSSKKALGILVLLTRPSSLRSRTFFQRLVTGSVLCPRW